MLIQILKFGLFALINQIFPIIAIFILGAGEAANYNIAILLCNYVYQLLTPTLIFHDKNLTPFDRAKKSRQFKRVFFLICAPGLIFVNLSFYHYAALAFVLLILFIAPNTATKMYFIEETKGDVCGGGKIEIFGALIQFIVSVIAVLIIKDIIISIVVGFVARCLAFVRFVENYPEKLCKNMSAEPNYTGRQIGIICLTDSLFIAHIGSFYSVLIPFAMASRSLGNSENSLYNILQTVYAIPPLVVISLRRFIYYKKYKPDVQWNVLLGMHVVFSVVVALGVSYCLKLLDRSALNYYDVSSCLLIISVQSLLILVTQINVLHHIDSGASFSFLLTVFVPMFVALFGNPYVDAGSIKSILYLNLTSATAGVIISFLGINNYFGKMASVVFWSGVIFITIATL